MYLLNTWRFFTRILFRLLGRGGGFGGSPDINIDYKKDFELVH